MKRSALGMLFSFAPFIVFFVIAAIVSPLAGLGCAFTLSLVFTVLDRRRGKSLKMLNTGSLILFSATAVYIMAVMPHLNANVVRVIVNGGLMLISLFSLAIGRPFTSQYAKEQIPEHYWNAPVFIRTNQIITMVWVLAFAVGTVATAASIYLPDIPSSLEIFATIASLAAAAWFTSWYPTIVRRSRAGSV